MRDETKASVFAVLAILSFMFVGYRTIRGVHYPSPKFKVGECIRLHQDLERWEENPYYIFRIEEIGLRKYRIQFFTTSKHLIPGEGVDFFHQDIYDLVPCPKERPIQPCNLPSKERK